MEHIWNNPPQVPPEEFRVDMDSWKIVLGSQIYLPFILDDNGQKWFPIKHSAKVLGYVEPKVAKRMIATIDPSYVKAYKDIFHLGSNPHPCGMAPSRNQWDTKYMKEAGLYALIIESDTPAPTRFKKWLCEDMLTKMLGKGI